jgi:hypothetical protein
MTRRRRKSIAWIALAAMLFGAVSPAFAAALFQGRPDILGRMLQMPAPAVHAAPQIAVIADDDGCPHETVNRRGGHEPEHSGHRGNAGHESHGDSQHAAHGTFCSFCLTASSVVTLLSAQLISLAPLAAREPIGVPLLWHADITPSSSGARGPPRF